jgi:uncharacterized protein (TIGR03437 family)
MTFAGVWQINVKVPEAGQGTVAVAVRVGQEISPPILLPVARD